MKNGRQRINCLPFLFVLLQSAKPIVITWSIWRTCPDNILRVEHNGLHLQGFVLFLLHGVHPPFMNGWNSMGRMQQYHRSASFAAPPRYAWRACPDDIFHIEFDGFHLQSGVLFLFHCWFPPFRWPHTKKPSNEGETYTFAWWLFGMEIFKKSAVMPCLLACLLACLSVANLGISVNPFRQNLPTLFIQHQPDIVNNGWHFSLNRIVIYATCVNDS